MLSNHDIVFLTGVFYDDLWTSKQQLARRLARHNRVLFVEPYLTAITPISVPSERANWKRALSRNALRTVDGLTIYSPPPLLPFRHYAEMVQALNDHLYVAAVRRVMRSLGFRKPILWSFIHDAGPAIGMLDERISIYHCADDWSEMPLPHKVTHRIKRQEHAQARKVDLVFSAAQKNTERLRALNPQSYYTPNGVDFELFNETAQAVLPPPPDIAGIKGPILGFIGTLHTWIDLALIRSVAEQHPEWSIVLIGPAKIDVSVVQGLPNIHLLGQKGRAELPAYLQAFDVCLIPFVDNNLTRAVNPLKLYEYLAAGKPIVSTNMPEVRTAAPYVAIAPTREAFVDTLAQVLAQQGAGAAERIAFARQNSWDGRVELLSNLIQSHLDEPQGPNQESAEVSHAIL